MSQEEVILVIEDDPPILDNILEILQINNYNVYGATNGIDGVEKAHELMPDLIMCDINMPELDGYGVLMTLRSDARTHHIPLVFLTAFVDREFQRRGMSLGAEDYLTKPFTPQELIDAVKTQLDKKRQQQAEMDELRLNLITALPHELRTPLNGILTCADLLLMDLEEGNNFEMERAEQMIRIIYRSGQRLHHHIENHLIYSQLKIDGKDPQRRAMMTYGEGIEQAFSLVMYTAYQIAENHERGSDIIEGEATAGLVKVSESNLKKIIQEVVDNAFKFSKKGTPVELHTGLENDHYCIRITDQGDGMEPEHIARVGAYMQFERSRREQQGMGLGLVIARELAALHGGRLDIDSQHGHGTQITLSFPLMEALE